MAENKRPWLFRAIAFTLLIGYNPALLGNLATALVIIVIKMLLGIE